MDKSYILGIAVCLWIAVIMLSLIIKLVKGPRLTDRIVVAGLFNTMVISAISVWAVCMGKVYLLDVALVFAIMSFFEVTILSGLIERHRKIMNLEKRGQKDD